MPEQQHRVYLWAAKTLWQLGFLTFVVLMLASINFHLEAISAHKVYQPSWIWKGTIVLSLCLLLTGFVGRLALYAVEGPSTE